MQTVKIAIASIILISVLSSSSAVQAQLLDYGFRGGVNMSSVANSSYQTDLLTGYHFGVFAEYRFRFFPIAIQPEVNYMQMGTKYEGIQVGFQSPQPATVKLNYVHLPVLLKAYVPTPGPVSPYLLGGPYAGFRSGIQFQVGNQVITQAEEWYRESDFGFVIGAGTRIGFGMADVDIDARLVFGMENIFDRQFEYDEQNRAIVVSAGFSF